MKSNKTRLVLALFLLGIFMGAIDSGIVTPAREIIQNSFGVKPNIGVWMITIYTLSYAVAMPIVSKLSDQFGYTRMYIVGIGTFAVGSFLVGMANFFGTFEFLLVARVIQAIGAGGIIPIATAVIGRSFPIEKRGMALGLVGGVYGIANILGPTLGSFILDIAGTDQWGWLFFINLPISAIILVFSYKLKEEVTKVETKLDYVGAVLTAGVIMSLMYALTNIDFFNFIESIKTVEVYPYLIIFAVLLPILVYVESNVNSPIINIRYFMRKDMVVAFLLAFIVGVGMMGMVFVPQFAENVLKIKAGSGGYLVTILAVFSGFAAPFSGKLVDKKGPGFVIRLGFTFTFVGTLFLGFVATEALNFISVLVGLALMGFGVGFTMGAPLNYIVLNSVAEHESAEALSTMSLIRSIGVTISPSLMIGFIARVGSHDLPKNLMEIIMKNFGAMMPQGAMNGSGNMFASLQSADVTTIYDSLLGIFNKMLPEQAVGTFVKQFSTIKPQIIDTFQSTINQGYTNMFICAATIAFVGIVVTFFIPKKDYKAIETSHTME